MSERLLVFETGVILTSLLFVDVLVEHVKTLPCLDTNSIRNIGHLKIFPDELGVYLRAGAERIDKMIGVCFSLRPLLSRKRKSHQEFKSIAEALIRGDEGGNWGVSDGLKQQQRRWEDGRRSCGLSTKVSV